MNNQKAVKLVLKNEEGGLYDFNGTYIQDIADALKLLKAEDISYYRSEYDLTTVNDALNFLIDKPVSNRFRLPKKIPL
jgi:D-arabinose 1-dehydrogenase-like Zn-dependent alcohol dehydrogenase